MEAGVLGGLGSGIAGENRKTTMGEVSGQLEDSLSRLQVMNQYLTELADRLYGPLPEGVENNVRECRPGALGKLQDQSDALSSLVSSLEDTARRLEEAA